MQNCRSIPWTVFQLSHITSRSSQALSYTVFGYSCCSEFFISPFFSSVKVIVRLQDLHSIGRQSGCCGFVVRALHD